MNSVFDHYAQHLAEHYSWMFGNFNASVDNFIKYFLEKNIMPSQGKLCIDLGCGSGFQSIALGQIGFDVKSVDFSEKLLNELNQKKGNLSIETVNEDLLRYLKKQTATPELVICMGDTLTHLDSLGDVEDLVFSVYKSLSPDGRFIISYRDLSLPLEGKDRFIPVKNDDDNKILTCFLEHHRAYVEVFDILHLLNEDHRWELKISSYKKLVVPEEWLLRKIEEAGFTLVEKEKINGMNYMISKK